MRTIILILIALPLILVGLGWIMAGRFSREVDGLRRIVLTPALAGSAFRQAGPLERLAVDAPAAAVAVRLTQTGQMRLGPDEPWREFSATHLAAIDKVGFVWDATFSMGPLVSARVIDAYAGQKGRLAVRLFGALPVGDEAGPDVDQGEALRYLAEIPWTLSALRANSALSSRADGDAVILTATGGAQVRLDFDEQGRVLDVTAPARPRRTDGVVVPTPWGGRFAEWDMVDGILMPRRGEVWWDLPEGRFVYWRGSIIGASYVDATGEPVAP